MAEEQGLFTFEDVSVSFDGSAVIANVDASIPTAGITAIIGPSGAGKSTMLRLCNRLEVPSRGSVTYNGRDLAELDPRSLRREVGMVFQRPTMFGGSVSDNFEVAAPDCSDEVRVAALDRATLDGTYLRRDAATLSGGEAQRVCLARTLLTEPRVLLLDEPTSSLDQSSKLSFEETALGLAGSGIPIVWVTHELEQVRRVANRVIVLVDGRLVASLDTPDELADQAELVRLLESGSAGE